MTEKAILCVDDDPSVLKALALTLERTFTVSTATSGAEGLKLLAMRPHAVVLSDMRMPEMNGSRFLSMVRALYPDTVRMLLTGHSDLADAADVVNNGSVFRMLLKPCPNPALVATVHDAFRQYDLQVAERQLLDQTLNGAVTMLSDILGLVHPLAFGRATRVSAIVKHVISQLKPPDSWQIELAAALSQIGCITLDSSLIERVYAGTASHDDVAAFNGHPAHARKLIERIPRLQPVADMVADQMACTTKHASPTTMLGCQLLRCALAIDLETSRHKIRYDEALAKVMKHGTWDPTLEPALHTFHANKERRTIQVQGSELRADMLLEVDAVSPKGELWIAKGNVLTYVSAKRLRSLAERGMLAQPLLVGLAP